MTIYLAEHRLTFRKDRSDTQRIPDTGWNLSRKSSIRFGPAGQEMSFRHCSQENSGMQRNGMFE